MTWYKTLPCTGKDSKLYCRAALQNDIMPPIKSVTLTARILHAPHAPKKLNEHSDIAPPAGLHSDFDEI